MHALANWDIAKSSHRMENAESRIQATKANVALTAVVPQAADVVTALSQSGPEPSG